MIGVVLLSECTSSSLFGIGSSFLCSMAAFCKIQHVSSCLNHVPALLKVMLPKLFAWLPFC
jgi:hypothetical protein